MTQSTTKQDGSRSWRLLNNVFDTLLIAGTCYVVVRLMIMWTEGSVTTSAVSTLTP